MKHNFFAFLFALFYAFTASSQVSVVNGWLQVSPSPDSRLIYVSDSEGDDATAQFYSPSSPEIGSNPFIPTGTIHSYKTISAAAAQLRSGYPDWILFKYGDTWTNQSFGSRAISGRNPNEPMLIGAWGTCGERPKILTGNAGLINLTGSSASFLVFSGLYAEPHTRSGTDEPVALRLIDAPFHHVWIENCYFTKFFQHLAIHRPSDLYAATNSNLTVRRCIFTDAYVTSSSHANAMYIANVDTILFEENLLDHNGWSTTVTGATPTGFRHNSYFQVSCRNLVFRDNIVARAAATGGGFRCGGIISNNLFLSNPKNIQAGTHENYDGGGGGLNWPTEFVTATITDNVIIDSRVESFEPGKGITVQRAKNSTVRNNIVAHFSSQSDYNYGIFINETESTSIDSNIIYNWGNNRSTGVEYSSAIAVGSGISTGNIFHNNDVQMGNSQGYCVSNYASFSNVSFIGNKYYNVLNPNNWFEPSGSYSSWLSASGETNSQQVQVSYPSPNNSIETYLVSLGLSGDLNSFLSHCKSQSVCNWQNNFSANSVNNYFREGFGKNTVSTSIPLYSDYSIRVFPNPAGERTIIFSEKKMKTISFINAAGKEMFSVTCNENSYSADLSAFPAGLYFVIIADEENSLVYFKLIKAR